MYFPLEISYLCVVQSSELGQFLFHSFSIGTCELNLLTVYKSSIGLIKYSLGAAHTVTYLPNNTLKHKRNA